MLSGPSTNDGKSNGIAIAGLGRGGRRGASSGFAQRDLNRMPRPMFLPLDTQSIHPAVIGHCSLASLSPARNASMLGIRSLSHHNHGEATRSILKVTSRM